MNEKKQMRLRQTWRMILRTLKVVHRMMPRAMPRSFALGIVRGARPFVPIYVSTWIINALTSGADARRVVCGALVGAGIAAAAHLAEEGFVSLATLTDNRVYYKTQSDVWRRYLTTDFERLEQPDFQKLKLDYTWIGAPTYAVLQFMVEVIAQAVSVILALITSIPLMIAAGPRMSLLMVGTIVLSLLLTFFIQNQHAQMYAQYIRRNVVGNRLFNYVGVMAGNYKIGMEARVFRAQGLIRSIGRHMNQQLYIRWGQSDGAYNAMSAGVSQVLNGSIFLLVALVALDGAFPIGSVVLFVGALTRLAVGVSTLIEQVTSRLITKNLEIWLAILDAEPIKYAGTLSTEKRDDAEYDIEFHDVSFKYPGSEDYALRNLNLKLRVGQHLAVVGMNGSGKTTMIKLLCRLYDPTEGVITLNDIDIRKYDLRQYMDLFSVVFQDFKLFAFKAGENVAAAREFDRARVIECCERAGYPDIDPDAVLYRDLDENGVEISGGEAQKLALARALYRDAPFMVLDEPTAALDPVAEFEIYTRFNTLMAGHTAIYISHRLSSCRFCDNIAVFHEGRLIQRGSHDELLIEGGKYAELWHAQAQYYTAS
jgi:ATP-binding cassette subfamily B protein